jgi:hypothetical protein
MSKKEQVLHLMKHIVKIYNNNNKNRDITIALVALALKSSLEDTTSVVDMAIQFDSVNAF